MPESLARPISSRLIPIHCSAYRPRGTGGGVRVAEELPDLPLDRLQLVLGRALASGHPVAAVLVLDEQRHGGEPMLGVQGVVADVPDGDPVQRDTGRDEDFALQAVEVGVDGGGLPSRCPRRSPRPAWAGRQQRRAGPRSWTAPRLRGTGLARRGGQGWWASRAPGGRYGVRGRPPPDTRRGGRSAGHAGKASWPTGWARACTRNCSPMYCAYAGGIASASSLRTSVQWMPMASCHSRTVPLPPAVAVHGDVRAVVVLAVSPPAYSAPVRDVGGLRGLPESELEVPVADDSEAEHLPHRVMSFGSWLYRWAAR